MAKLACYSIGRFAYLRGMPKDGIGVVTNAGKSGRGGMFRCKDNDDHLEATSNSLYENRAVQAFRRWSLSQFQGSYLYWSELPALWQLRILCYIFSPSAEEVVTG